MIYSTSLLTGGNKVVSDLQYKLIDRRELDCQFVVYDTSLLTGGDVGAWSGQGAG